MSDVDAKQAISAGFSEPIEVTFNTRELILYALGTGTRDLKFIYEGHEDFAALPWYPVVLPFKGRALDVVDFPSDAMDEASDHIEGLPMPMGAVLDGERFMHILKPLPSEGGAFLMKNRVIGIHDKKRGALVESEAIIYREEDGEEVVYVKMVTGTFYVGVTGFKSGGETFSQVVDVPTRAPDHTVEQRVAENQAELYRLSGDYNPLHVDPDSSEAFGYDKPILHGLCSLGFSLRHVMRACCDNDPAQISSFKARFSKPVFPGQTLVTRMWRVSAKDAEGQACIRVVFETRVKETDAVCMNQCYVDLKSASTLASKL